MKFERQVLTQLTGTVVLMASQWLISVLLVRLGGFGDAGIFALAMSMANIFAAIADCGIRNYLISDTKKEFPQEQYIFARLAMILLSFIVCGGYLLLEAGTYVLQEQVAILIYLLYLNINRLSEIHFGALQMRGKLYVNGFSNTMRGILGAAAFFTVYILTHNMTFALFAMALNSMFIFILYDHRQYHNEFGHLTTPFKNDFFAIFLIVRKCIPLMMVLLCNLILAATPRRTINIMLGNEQLGYFSSLFAPAALISTMGDSVVYSFVPKLAEKWENNDKKDFLRLAGRCYGGIIAFTMLAELCAILAGRSIMRLIFGEEIMLYYEILYLAIISYGLSAMSFTGYSVLLALRKLKTLFVIGITGVLFMISTVGILIGKMGIAGAAIVLIMTYILQCTLHLIVFFLKLKGDYKNEQY